MTKMTIADEVNPSAWAEAAMLIRRVLTSETDLDGFHALEQQVQTAWMPQALACVAAQLLTDSTSHLGADAAGELLSEAIDSIRSRQMKNTQT